MKRIIIFLFLVFIFNISAMTQNFRDINLILEKSDQRTIYLTSVEKFEHHNFFTETGESDIQMWYKISRESESEKYKYASEKTMSIQLIPDSIGRYKIIEH